MQGVVRQGPDGKFHLFVNGYDTNLKSKDPTYFEYHLGRRDVVKLNKLGLTSVAKQRQMDVDEPLYGWLTDDMQLDTGQAVVCDRYIQPRCEPEIAFLLGADLSGPHVLAAHVLAATALVFPAIDVLDSRFAGYKFTGADVIADNSSCAGFVFGGQGTDPRGIDLRLTGCVLEHNGRLVATAAGAAVLGVDQGEEVDPFVQLFGGVSEVGDTFGHVLRGPTGSVLPARKDSGAVVDDEIHEP